MYETKKLFKPVFFLLLIFSLSANNITPHYIYDPWEISQIGEKESSTIFYIDELESILRSTPRVKERTPSKIVINMPLRNGEKTAFRFYETSVMHPNLVERYPMIKSYMGVGVSNPSHRASVVINNGMIMGMSMTQLGNSFFQSFDLGSGRESLQVGDELISPDPDYVCKVEDEFIINSRDVNDDIFPDCVGMDDPCIPVGSELVTHRVAVVVTEDVNNEVADGTVEGGLTWLVGIVNQINLIWVRDLSFRMQIVGNNDLIIHTNSNPVPDQFKQECAETGNPSNCELPEVEPYLDAVIGPGGWEAEDAIRQWEYGACIDLGYGGGLGYCPGATSVSIPSYLVFSHEAMHNVGSNHNLTKEGGIGSSIGGSIMYWSTNSARVPGNNAMAYTSHSLEIGMNYKASLPNYYGNFYSYVNGYETQGTGNVIPDVIVPTGGYVIPKETPFVLEGSSSPMYPEYTFNWEQNDATSEVFWNDTESSEFPFFNPVMGPLFTTVDPTQYGYRRTFPSMNSLVNNEYETYHENWGNLSSLVVEKLPFASREINMRMVVRTNDPYAGSVNHKNVQFFVAGTAGPFRVTSQSDPTVWEVGSQQTINWNVANTNDPDSVNCQNVDLVLSLNGGDSFDFILFENVPNNGSYTFTVPPTPPTVSARLMVRASDNIFFDINNGNITIQNNNLPSLALSQALIDIELDENTMETFSVDVTNDGEEGSVISFITYPGKDFMINEKFSEGILPTGWSVSTNAECDNPGWFVSEDASSSYFTIPLFDGSYIATNDDACGSSSDGSSDMLYTNSIVLPEGQVELSFHRYFTAGFSQTFHVYVSTDSWTSQEEVFTLDYGDGNDEWVQETVNLYQYSGETIEVAFHSNDNGNWASGVALDNIQLGLTPSWITSSSMGIINYQETETFDFSIMTQGLSNGVYSARVIIEDPYQSLSDTLGINLTVSGVVGVDDDVLPHEFSLYQNFPNPFNPSTDIKFSLPNSERVHLVVYDLLGNVVREMVNEDLNPGMYTYKWMGENQSGSTVSAGMYFYQIEAGSFSKTRKMILLK